MSIDRYKLGDWTVSPGLNRLDGPAGNRTLEPKVMELLVCLVEAGGSVVNKEELVARVWNGHRIADSALTRSISELRRALGDDAQDPLYIETIAKRGYRIVADIEVGAGQPQGWRLPWGTKKWTLAVPFCAVLFLAGLAAMTYGRESPELARDFVELAPEMAPVRLMQVSTAPGIEAFPDYSPDGTAVVYSAVVDGKYEIFVQQLTPGGGRLQLTKDRLQNVQPTWSPDGQSIAYHSMVRQGIWVLSALGGEPRRVASFGSDPAWLGDSKSLVFQSGALVQATLNNTTALPPSILYRAWIGRTTPEPLTTRGAPEGGHSAPQVSVDGERIVFSVNDLARRGLYSIKSDGTELKLVLGAPQDDAVFSADGRYIYSTGSSKGEQWLFRTRYSTATGDVLAAPERLVRGAFRGLTFSPLGDRLMATSIDQSSNIFTLDPTPGPTVQFPLERQLTHGTNFRDTSPTISPDGQQIAYRQQRFGQLDQIWLVATDGSGNAQLTLDPDIAAHVPSWSADGRQVFFQTFRSGRKSINRLAVTDRQSDPWLDIPFEWKNVRVSKDGAYLLFHQLTPVRGENGDQFMANNAFRSSTETLVEERLTALTTFAGFPVLSDSNDRVVYELEQEGHFVLEVLDLESGQTKRLAERGHNWPGSFVSDQGFVFVAQRDGIWNLYLVDTLTGSETQLTDNTSVQRYYLNPSTSSQGGGMVVYERGDVDGDLWEIKLES